MVRAKKHLGQHFLTDPNIARKIAESLPKDALNIVEVGPGTGFLTREILAGKSITYFGFDVDDESVDYLKKHFPEIQDSFLLQDFLQTRLEDFFKDKITVVGNFPYNISSQILFKVLENRELIYAMVGMFQKEVAERITAAPGSKRYGILSVLSQAFFDLEYLFTVHENVFRPNPKVKSAVIRLTRNGSKDPDCNHSLFFKVVKTGFNQRRKTLRNSLKSLLGNTGSSSYLLAKRPEQLSVEEFTALTKLIESA